MKKLISCYQNLFDFTGNVEDMDMVVVSIEEKYGTVLHARVFNRSDPEDSLAVGEYVQAGLKGAV